jgi:hypothetical protein
VINDPAPDSPIDRPRAARVEQKGPPPAPEPPAPLLPPRQAGQGWIGWSVGSGYGWYSSGPLESNPNLRLPEGGFGVASLGHFGAEIGAQWSDSAAFSLISRHQVIRHSSTDPGVASTGHSWAHSLFARGVYLMPREGAQFYLGGLVGGGQGFRFKIDAQPGSNLVASDTVRGGMFVVGPVGGLILPIADRLSLEVEARILGGLPDKAVVGELNIGAQFDLFSLK